MISWEPGLAYYAWEFLRFVALIEFAVIYGLTARIIQRYYHARRVAPGGLGLLPSHVWMIGVAYLIAIGDIAVHLIQLLDEPPVWDVLPFALGTGTLGVIALRKILAFEDRRVKKGGDEVTVTDSRGLRRLPLLRRRGRGFEGDGGSWTGEPGPRGEKGDTGAEGPEGREGPPGREGRRGRQ